MSSHHRGGTGHADAFYSRFRRAWDCAPVKRTPWSKGNIRTHTLAPAMDGDWWWYDGDTSHPGLECPSIVACIDTKLPGEAWTLNPPRGNGLQAMANLGPAAFVLEIDIRRLRFKFYALNVRAANALMAMDEWCKRTGRKLHPIERHRVGEQSCQVMTVAQKGHWHFEMLVRAQFRGEVSHDVAEVDHRLDLLRDKVSLPQQPGQAIVLPPFEYGPKAIAQRRLGAAAGLDPVEFHVAQLRELYEAKGRIDLLAILDDLEQRAAIREAVELSAKERRLRDAPGMKVRDAVQMDPDELQRRQPRMVEQIREMFTVGSSIQAITESYEQAFGRVGQITQVPEVGLVGQSLTASAEAAMRQVGLVGQSLTARTETAMRQMELA